MVSPEQEFSVISVVPCKGATLNDLPEMADMEVSKKNRGTPKSSKLDHFSAATHDFGDPPFKES